MKPSRMILAAACAGLLLTAATASAEVIGDIERGKALEVNTNGLYMTPSTMPETAIIRRYYELGGEMVTVGSDAHYETVVGHAVAETLDVLQEIGFRYVCAFDSRKPRFIKIP